MKSEVVKFTTYSIIERLLITLVNMVSIVIIGRLGSAELSGMSISNTIINILQAPFLAISTGAVISVSANEKNKEEITLNIILLTTIVSVILMCVVAGFSKQLIFLLFPETQMEIKDIATSNLSVFKWALPFMGIEMGLSGCLKGCRNAKMPMLITLVGDFISVILCMVFVSRFNMGYMAGVYSLVISSAIICVIRTLCLCLPGSEIRLNFNHKVNSKSIKKVVIVSAPFLVNLFFVRIGFLGMQSITSLLGTETLAGYQISNNVLNILYAITGGIETAAITFVSNRIAIGKRTVAKKLTSRFANIGTGLMIIFGVAVFVCAEPISKVFASEKMAIENGIYVIRIMSITIPFTSYFQCIQGSLNACGHSNIVAFFTIFCTWCLRMPIAYLLVKYADMGFYGLLVGFLVDYISRSVVYGYVAYKEFKKP